METTIEHSKKKKSLTKPVLKTKTKAVKDSKAFAEKRISMAHRHYREMQANWYQFASSIREIRDLHDHDVLGIESFQKLCEREFPSMSYSLISKFIQISEKLGEQINRRLETVGYNIPTYETCYQLTTIQTKVKEDEYKKLSKLILDDKLTVRDFRERIKSLIGDAKRDLKRKIDDETEQFMDKTQRELDAELRHSGGMEEEESLLDGEDFDPSDEEDEDGESEDVTDETTVTDNILLALAGRAEYLIENLPEFVDQVDKVDAPVKSLLKKLKKLGSIIRETIETIEEK